LLSVSLLDFQIDSLTSSVSTAPYTSDYLNKMLHLVSQVKPGKRQGHSACYVGRMMKILAHHKFLHFHGQNGARLNQDQSIYIGLSKRSLLISMLSPVLFGAPDVHLRTLKDIWIDDIIFQVSEDKAFGELQANWEKFTLYCYLPPMLDF